MTRHLQGHSWTLVCGMQRYGRMKARHLMECITFGSTLFPEFKIATTAALSHQTWTAIPVHCLSDIAAAKTIGTSSFTVMWASFRVSVHTNCNQLWSQNAPQPHPPEASDVTIPFCSKSVPPFDIRPSFTTQAQMVVESLG